MNVQNPKTWKNNLGYTAEFGGDATAFGYDNAGGAIPVVTTFGLEHNFLKLLKFIDMKRNKNLIIETVY